MPFPGTKDLPNLNQNAGLEIRTVRVTESERTSNPLKEIVLVTLAIDTETGEIDPAAPFMVILRRRALQRLPGRGGIYENEPGAIEQFRPGDREAQFEAEWSKQEGGWKFGKRVDDA
jgi:hypothetical protein